MRYISSACPCPCLTSKKLSGEMSKSKCKNRCLGNKYVELEDDIFYVSTMNLHDLFEKHTIPEPNTGCLLWTKGVHEYGTISVNGKTLYAHRFAFSLFNGNIPSGMLVCHKCDTPGCVNPEHLWLGTINENNADKTRKGRHPFGSRNHCGKGHQYTPETLRISNGKRRCLVCQKKNSKNRRKVLL
ncbi:HNH endonuclease signature motif containing protein [Bdellovibrio sp. ArHS]|uniref:HNH endonuclease signature motif containing protein n=1 Tax=Bdellovibrio sp. ArHS TaxID=1569284 RepID=UPI0034480D93